MVRALGFYQGLSASPFVSLSSSTSTSALSWISSIVDDISEINVEVQDFMDTGDQQLWEDLGTYKGQETGWSQIAMIDFFSEKAKFSSALPKTAGILKAAAGTRIGPRHVALARQKRGTGIPQHCDLFNWMLTLHLPLLGPGAGCGIIVDGERRDWVPGKPSVMDTTFLHETYNESEDDLILLLVDFWHFELTDLECDELKEFLLLTNYVGQGMKDNE
ncbi:hypothetical protein TrVE_jg3871 [Triparma verrucosa]|uniref:Aspartyl/asparaginy/proline hydroxylase domain-containing protein n=1 Tax=Triparma verrucosa TaxID=1606542 RepID=A0A9W7F1C2_9STRA|nr:hypothetical protein TrVE_jg3871 [Triparma verrucosa]